MKSAISRSEYDQCRFSHFAIRLPKRRMSGRQKYQKHGSKRCYPERAPEIKHGFNLRGKRRKTFATCPNNADVSAYESSIMFGLPRSVYLMHALDGVGQQKPTDEDTIEGRMPEASQKKQEQTTVGKQAGSLNNMRSASKNQGTPIPPLAPPPPIAFSGLPAPSDEEALSSMLMSWYMSGYHTGYYQALQDQKNERKGETKQR